MELVISRCAGMDVHQATVVVTVRVPDEAGRRRSVTETFGTMTPDLLALRDWLQGHGVTHVAMESTGVYWKPVYYVLEDAFTLLLINMHELKRVPGRKTDVQDSEWLAQVLECGLLKTSFVPPPPIRELRDLTRYRVQREDRFPRRDHRPPDGGDRRARRPFRADADGAGHHPWGGSDRGDQHRG